MTAKEVGSHYEVVHFGSRREKGEKNEKKNH